jgi:hypothetical protein
VAHSNPTDTSEQDLSVSKEILESTSNIYLQSCVERIELGSEWKIRMEESTVSLTFAQSWRCRRQQAEDDSRSACVRLQLPYRSRLVCFECASMPAESQSRFQLISNPKTNHHRHQRSKRSAGGRKRKKKKRNPTYSSADETRPDNFNFRCARRGN